MPPHVVTSLADPRLASYAQLNQSNLTRGSGLFVAEGDKVVERLIASDFEVDSLLAEEAWARRFETMLPPGTPVYVISRDLMRVLVGFAFHRGVLACGRRKQTPKLLDLIQAKDESALLLVCPAVQDPSNLGNIIRSATALGATGLLLGKECADPFSRRVLRVSMGAAFVLPIRESPDLATDLTLLSTQHGFDVVATVLDPHVTPLADAVRPQRLAIVLGSEGHGLDDCWLTLCSGRVTLPMHSGVDSLNVANAAAIFLYHFTQAKVDSRSPSPHLE
jgi:tRNA G18 (ribose-2'-O)-methylase SpoU